MWILVALLASAGPPGRWYPADDPLRADEIAALEALGYAQHGDVAPGPRVGVVQATEHAWQGLNLYSSGHRPEAVLMDMDGRVLHRWQRDFLASFPGQDALLIHAAAHSWRRVALLPDGGLLAIHEGIGIVCLGPDSSLRWVRANRAHHDLEVLPDGRILVLTRAQRNLGGVPVLDDVLTTLSPDGQDLRQVSILGALRSSPFRAELDRVPAEVGQDWLHTNTLHLLDGRASAYHPAWVAGHVLLVARHLSLWMVMDPEGGRITWVGRGPWVYPHDAEIGPSGRAWLFDNRGAEGFSRVLALDPSAPDRVVWSWSDHEQLHSPVLGAVQELPNGNVLVTESTRGRAVEVRPDGEVVWDFHNPATHERLVAVVFEMLRLPVEAGAFLCPDARAALAPCAPGG